MINPLVGQITLGIYALLLGVGGLMGYLKAGSRPSLIAGSISALAAILALGLSAANHALGVPLGLILSITLFVLFGYRYAVKTRKFMPSGLLAVVSLIVLAVMFLVMDWSGTRIIGLSQILSARVAVIWRIWPSFADCTLIFEAGCPTPRSQ